MVVDSQLRIRIESQMVRSAENDVAVVTTSAASDERRRALENHGIRVLTFDGPGGRADFPAIASGWLNIVSIVDD